MYCETISNNTVKIRKPHQCYSCMRKFEVGSMMRNWVGKYDGEFGSVYSCQTCDEIMRLCPCEGGEGYPEGFVWEMLNDGQTPEDLLQNISRELELKK